MHDGIIEDYKNVFENNPNNQKALAYIYDSQNRYEEAHKLYKDVFISRQNHIIYKAILIWQIVIATQSNPNKR